MKFEQVTFRNFISYGNSPTTFKFTEGEVGVLVGKNGTGKSTVLESVYFALTGKPYRKINKGDILNTTNKKDCHVSLDFSVGSHKYTVNRGIKPNVFEIYRNGTLLNESDSDVRDYQSYLEKITGLTPDTIKQILILSNRFYKPFLELEASPKREFLEGILGISLLSDMAESLKQKGTSLKQEEAFLDKDISSISSNITIVEEYIQKQKREQADNTKEIKEEILRLQKSIESNEGELAPIDEAIEGLEGVMKDQQVFVSYKDKILSKISSLESEIRKANAQLTFYRDNDKCPECDQKIDEAKKNESVSSSEQIISASNVTLGEYKTKYEKVKSAEKIIQNAQDQKYELRTKKSRLALKIENDKSTILSLKAQLNKKAEAAVDETSKLLALKEEREKTQVKKLEVERSKKHVATLLKLIGDKGFRKAILNKYLPVLNTYVNFYLEVLDAYYRVEFNEEMDCKIVAKGYENLDYGSFSAGEKQRCDLAIVFSFLEISKMRNNIYCNLLCIDEMFGDLDDEGLDGLKKILDMLKEKMYNVTMITHVDKIKELGDKTFLATKKKFSKLEELTNVH